MNDPFPPEVQKIIDDVFSKINLKRCVFEMTEEEELEYVKKYVETMYVGCECISVRKISENNYDVFFVPPKPCEFIKINFTIQDGESNGN